MPFRFEPEAADELDEAVSWYEGRRTGLGTEFLEAVDAALAHIARWPRAGVPLPEIPADLSVRAVPVGRFPYRIVYLEIPDDIRILAIPHDHRLPGYWRARARK